MFLPLLLPASDTLDLGSAADLGAASDSAQQHAPAAEDPNLPPQTVPATRDATRGGTKELIFFVPDPAPNLLDSPDDESA